MEDRMESYYFFEEELITKMHLTFIQRFNLDNYMAAELAQEIMEILKVSQHTSKELNSHYLQ